MAVGGGGIVSGMTPKGFFDAEGAEQIIQATRAFKQTPPGGVGVHHDHTGFFREKFDTEEGVLDAIKKCMAGMPCYEPDFFRVDAPRPPKYGPEEIDYLVPMNQKQVYGIEDVLARFLDNSEHMEYRPGYGPEVYCGLAKLDGFLVGVIANRQGFLGKDYPEYADYIGIGGKLYRQGLIKMNELVTLCGRDRVPLIWFQDTSGIDVGDIAEKAELLGLGQSLIYSIEVFTGSHDVRCIEEGNRRRPLHHGRAPGPEKQCLHARRAHHGDLRDARGDRVRGGIRPSSGERARRG
jgi:glutaconyl-CoA decarboxylase